MSTPVYAPAVGSSAPDLRGTLNDPRGHRGEELAFFAERARKGR